MGGGGAPSCRSVSADLTSRIIDPPQTPKDYNKPTTADHPTTPALATVPIGQMARSDNFSENGVNLVVAVPSNSL